MMHRILLKFDAGCIRAKDAVTGCLLLMLLGGVGILGCPSLAVAQDSLHTVPPPPSEGSLTIEVPEQTNTLIDSPAAPLPWYDSLRHIHDPRKAAFYSAVFPGLGQIYNRQYIKAPLMWGGIGVAAGIFIFNFNHYITFRDAYRLRLNGRVTHDPRIDIYSPADLRYIRDGYRQYVDYSVLGFAAVYLYNILDAIVFAHLYHFDVSNDLSKIKFGPVIHQNDPYLGFGFTYTFKN